jgi:hypothetical protein
VPVLLQVPAAAGLTVWINNGRLGPKLVFISYRSADGAFQARSLQQALRLRYVNSWLDKDDLRVGNYRTKILRRIPATPNYLLVLTAGVIVRAGEPGSMLREEIDCAGLTVPVNGDPQDRDPKAKKPKIIIVEVKQSSEFKEPSAAMPSETEKGNDKPNSAKASNLVVQLANALDKSNPNLRVSTGLCTENTISFDHAKFGTMMREIGHALVGLNDRQMQAFRDLTYIEPDELDETEAPSQ